MRKLSFFSKILNAIRVNSRLFFASSVLFVFSLSFAIFGEKYKYFSKYYLLLIFVIFSFLLFFIWKKLEIKIEKENFAASLKKIIILFGPSQLAILYAMEKISCTSISGACLIFNCFFPLATFVFFSLVSIFLFLTINKKSCDQKSDKINLVYQEKEKKNIFSMIFVIFIMITNFGFGYYHLSEKAAVDERLWIFGRIQKFWNNVGEGEFHKTTVSDKPGITLAIISGTGLSQIDPKNFSDSYWKNTENPSERIETIKKINNSFRFPVLLFGSLMLPFFYFLTKKLFGRLIALVCVSGIGLSPILLGISTIVNPDSILWIFAPLSILSFLLYLKGNTKYLFVSGIFLGLSILTKYVANILYIFFFTLILLEYFLNRFELNGESPVSYFKRKIVDFFNLVLVSFLSFYLLLPAVWEQPSRVLEATIFSVVFQKILLPFLLIILIFSVGTFIGKGRFFSKFSLFISKNRKYVFSILFGFILFLIVATMANTFLEMKFFDFEAILASPKTSYHFSNQFSNILAGFYSLIFGLSPFLFVGMIYVIFKNVFRSDKNSLEIFYILLFILAYYFASSMSQVGATVRYQIILYPLAIVIASVGIVRLFEKIKIRKYESRLFLLVLLTIFFIFELLSIKPFYFSYASKLLPNEYVLNLKDMGDGSYEAAQYLNSLPNSNKLIIWSDKDGVCSFFNGRCINAKDPNNVELFDYFVVSSGRETRTTRLITQRIGRGKNYQFRLDRLYKMENPEFKLEIGGRPNNYIKIFPASKLTPENN